ncbi:MAG: PP2C family protein-serine/threonine phosphatase [Deltaproteobacteria bacterium]
MAVDPKSPSTEVPIGEARSLQPRSDGAALWECAAATDVGKVRDHNEDRFTARPELGLFLVCDGMGGHSAGEVAADLAVAVTTEFFERCARDPDATWPYRVDPVLGDEGSRLAVALRWANERIRAEAKRELSKANMGTTAVAALLGPERGFVAHAGDSRAYLFRDGALTQVTLDHSLLGDFIRGAHPTAEEIRAFPYKNVITRALGPADDVKIECAALDLRAGDLLMLCCDGLHGMVEDPAIAKILRDSSDLPTACRLLVEAANAAGGVDNITVILVRRRDAVLPPSSAPT